jgi:Neuraminidase (sialidase)
LRDKHNKIFGAKSTDGGKTWGKNIMIYASPDTTVCECCKPSVVMKGNNIYVMFRNWLNGNRDLHIIQSTDIGLNFGQAQKLGAGSWTLNGCPMDGANWRLIIMEFFKLFGIDSSIY